VVSVVSFLSLNVLKNRGIPINHLHRLTASLQGSVCQISIIQFANLSAALFGVIHAIAQAVVLGPVYPIGEKFNVKSIFHFHEPANQSAIRSNVSYCLIVARFQLSNS
jgi:hypothetical protein